MKNPEARRNKARARRPGPGVTIDRIAEEAGVSTATVSRVLNHPDQVSDETRRRVLGVMKRHHFVAHGLAGGLASRRSRVIGLLIPTITNSIYASSTQAVQRTAQGHGYAVLVGVSEFSPSLEEGLVRKLLERRVDGLILTGEQRSRAIYQTIGKLGVPYVVTWQLARAHARPCVAFDNRTATRLALDHLWQLGHRTIGLICGRSDVNDRALARRDAFVEFMAEHGVRVAPGLILERDFEIVQGRTAMHDILRHAPRPTAVFCANDIQAMGALYECADSGLRVPDDISIIGFDDHPMSQYTSPQLTTVRVPAEEMGRRAAEELLRTIDDGEPGHATTRIELPTALVVRQTTGRAP